ncbi:MAG: ABC transporter substrate-binding protein [Chloroflexi bacterium]|nr:ABC transporter substrate-binding protein [Chloroflexota bacterium]
MFRKAFLLVILVAIIWGVAVGLQPTRPTKAQDKVEITFVHIYVDDGNDNRGQIVQALVDQFMAEHPNIQVNIQSTTTDYQEVFNNTLLAAEQGNAPHVVQLEETSTQLAVDSTYFVKISDIATDEQKTELADFIPQILNFYTINDEVWSLPWNSSTPLLYYNKTLFEKAGLDPNTPPKTFADVLAACDTIMNAGLNLAGCINWPMASWFPEVWVAMQNSTLLNNDNGRSGRATESNVNSPEMLSIIQWWKELSDKGYYDYTGKPSDYVGEATSFITQRFAMHINSTAGLANFIRFAKTLGYDLGVAPIVIPNEQATQGLYTGGGSLWVTGGHSDEEIAAARDFIFFMTSTANNVQWHKETGYMPNRFSSLDALEAEGWFEANPFYRVAVDQLLNTVVSPATAGPVMGPAAQVRDFLVEAVQSVIDQGEDPAAALDVAKQRSDEALQEYNDLVGGN